MSFRFAVWTLTAALVVSAEPAPAPSNDAEITVEVGPLRNLRGALGCLLFAQPQGFPGDPKHAAASQRQEPKGNIVVCKFTGLAPGTYAVSALHDEDGNGKMNTNLFGVPTEGYGASNNKLPSMSVPTFEDASFKLARGEKKKLSVQIKY